MRKYLQAFFRHRFLILAPILLGSIAGGYFSSGQPRVYLSVARLWADSSVPNESTILATPNPTPAAQQASVMQELLQTRDFLNKVAERETSQEFLKPAQSPFDDATLATVAVATFVSTPGPHFIAVSVTAKSPDAAAGLVTSVIEEYAATLGSTLTVRANALVKFQTQNLASAAKALEVAQMRLNDYLISHPTANPGILDQSALQLSATVAAAQQQYASVGESLSKAQLTLASIGDSDALRVVDPPSTPTGPEGRMKTLIFAVFGGLFLGGMISVFLLIFFVVSDPTARQAADVEASLGLRVVGSIDEFKRRQIQAGENKAARRPQAAHRSARRR